MSKNIAAQIKNLRFGDLIEVGWLDASEATGRLQRAHFDTSVRSVGFFLGIKGRKTKHVVIAKEVIDAAKAYHYNIIPIGMIEDISVYARDVLEPETKRVLKKFVQKTMFKLKGKDGWIYAEGKIKKRLH